MLEQRYKVSKGYQGLTEMDITKVITNDNWKYELPKPVNSVITLQNGQDYRFKGYVDISPNVLKVETGDTVLLRGGTSITDTIYSKSVEPLISGSQVFIETRHISLENEDGPIWDISGDQTNLITTFTDYFQYTYLGKFTDVAYILIDNSYVTTSDNSVGGFQFFGQQGAVYFAHLQVQRFKGSLIDLGTSTVKNFSTTRALIGIDATDTGQRVIDGLPDGGNVLGNIGGLGVISGLDIIPIGGSVINYNIFSGVNPKDIYWRINDVPTQQDSTVFTEASESQNTISLDNLTSDGWKKVDISRTTLSEYTQRYIKDLNEDLKYIGRETGVHHISTTISYKKVTGGKRDYEFAIFKNANQDATTGERISGLLPTQVEDSSQVISVLASSEMLQNDWIGFYIKPIGHTHDVLVESITLQIKT